MGERISWAEGAQQIQAMQTLMLEAMSTQYPEVGLLVQTDEPELFIDYLNRAKQKEPFLQDIIISIKSAGIVLYHNFRKAEEAPPRKPTDVGETDGQENRQADDPETHSGV